MLEEQGIELVWTKPVSDDPEGKDIDHFAEGAMLFAHLGVDAEEVLLATADLAIDGGATHCQAPSTVVDLVEKRVVREGAGEFAFRNE